MTRRIRQLLMLVALVALMTLGGASAALGHPHPGNSADAKCLQAASNFNGTNYNPATATGNEAANPHRSLSSAYNSDQIAWKRCSVDANS